MLGPQKKTDGIQTQDRIKETFTNWLIRLQNLTRVGHVLLCCEIFHNHMITLISLMMTRLKKVAEGCRNP